jgi:hypothetical protein
MVGSALARKKHNHTFSGSPIHCATEISFGTHVIWS